MSVIGLRHPWSYLQVRFNLKGGRPVKQVGASPKSLCNVRNMSGLPCPWENAVNIIPCLLHFWSSSFFVYFARSDRLSEPKET